MSSLNLNKTILSGHLAETPELKQTTSGISVCQLRLMVNRKKKADGTQECDGFNIVAWRTTAEFACRYFKKGMAMCVVGSLQTRSYTDQQNQKRYLTEIVADELLFVDSAGSQQTQQNQQETPKNSAGDVKDNQTSKQTTGQQQAANTPQYAQAQQQPQFETLDPDDDLPF